MAMTKAMMKMVPMTSQKIKVYCGGSSCSMPKSLSICGNRIRLKMVKSTTSNRSSLVTQFLPRRTSANHSTKLTVFSVEVLMSLSDGAGIFSFSIVSNGKDNPKYSSDSNCFRAVKNCSF